MLPYYALVFLPAYAYAVGLVKGKKWNKLCIALFFIILIVVLSLRSINVGVDVSSYNHFYNTIAKLPIENVLSFSEKGEKLYYILNKVVSNIGADFQIFLAIVALISVLPILKLYYKKSDNALLTIALFLAVAPFSIFFSGLRQCIAIGIVIFAFKYVEEKKLIKFIICIIIAFFFHRSSVFALALYPIYHAKITKKWLYIIIPAMLMIFIFNKPIFAMLLSSFNNLYEGTITSTGAYSILILLVIFAIYCFIIPNNEKIDKEYIGFRNILLLSIVIQCFAPLNSTVMRINYYYLLFVPILIPKAGLYCKSENKKIANLATIIMTVFFIFRFFYSAYFGADILQIFPYIPCWEV